MRIEWVGLNGGIQSLSKHPIDNQKHCARTSYIYVGLSDRRKVLGMDRRGIVDDNGWYVSCVEFASHNAGEQISYSFNDNIATIGGIYELHQREEWDGWKHYSRMCGMGVVYGSDSNTRSRLSQW